MAKFSFKEVMPCLFAIFVDVLGYGLVAPLLVALFTSPERDVFEISYVSLRYLDLGLTLALYPLLMFFGSSFIGDLSDIIGRKKTLILSMVGMGLGFSLMGIGIIASSLTLFFIGRGLSGLLSASQSVALATLSDLSTQENKAIHLSYVALVQCLGYVIGPLMGGVLASMTLYAPFLGAALLAIVAFFWILLSFEESYLKKSSKRVSLTRFFKVFIEAYQNQRIRELCLIFFAMQVGVALYFPVILILLTYEFQYTPPLLGVFNGYLGIGFALGLLLILPRMLKQYKIEKIVLIALFTTLLGQFLSSLLHPQVLLWIVALPWALAVEIAFSGMFTSFSNATDEASQGWAMGIAVAVIAIAWALAGFSTQWVHLLGPRPFIMIGSAFLLISTLLMKKYRSKYRI